MDVGAVDLPHGLDSAEEVRSPKFTDSCPPEVASEVSRDEDLRHSRRGWTARWRMSLRRRELLLAKDMLVVSDEFDQGVCMHDDGAAPVTDQCLLKSCGTNLKVSKLQNRIWEALHVKCREKSQKPLRTWASGQKAVVGMPCPFVSYQNSSAMDSLSGPTLNTCTVSGNAVIVEFTAWES